jgi:TPR repeat protein
MKDFVKHLEHTVRVMAESNRFVIVRDLECGRVVGLISGILEEGGEYIGFKVDMMAPLAVYSSGYVLPPVNKEYYLEHEVDIDYAEDADVADALCELGDYYRSTPEDTGEEIDEEILFNIYKIAAKLGDRRAMNNVGVCYHNGVGTKKNGKKAAKWYKKAMAQGNMQSIINLANIYHKGMDMPKKLKKAFQLYRMAALLGDVDAQRELGVCYSDGDGVKKNPKKAFHWFEKASKNGSMTAAFDEALCYYYGEGVKKDQSMAIYLMEDLVRRGSRAAERVLDKWITHPYIHKQEAPDKQEKKEAAEQ